MPKSPRKPVTSTAPFTLEDPGQHSVHSREKKIKEMHHITSGLPLEKRCTEMQKSFFTGSAKGWFAGCRKGAVSPSQTTRFAPRVPSNCCQLGLRHVNSEGPRGAVTSKGGRNPGLGRAMGWLHRKHVLSQVTDFPANSSRATITCRTCHASSTIVFS